MCWWGDPMKFRSLVARLAACVILSKAIRVVACLGSAVLLFGFPLFSQVNTGRILGTVTDQTGGVIVGAMVTVTHTETGVARHLVTDGAGASLAPNWNAGKYLVRASAVAFQAFERQDIEVGVGQASPIYAPL